MGSNIDFINFLCEQIEGYGQITNMKMFGDYLVYCNGKPIFLVCNDTVYVKMNEETSKIVGEALVSAPPYRGAKPHYIIEDIDNREFMQKLAKDLEKITPLPKPKKKKLKI